MGRGGLPVEVLLVTKYCIGHRIRQKQIIIIIIIIIINNDVDYINVDVVEHCVSIGHLERDLSQKRVLMDDIKLKLTSAQENAETDADVMVLLICSVYLIGYKLCLALYGKPNQTGRYSSYLPWRDGRLS